MAPCLFPECTNPDRHNPDNVDFPNSTIPNSVVHPTPKGCIPDHLPEGTWYHFCIWDIDVWDYDRS